jgi:crossover junction endodeoxyribonuclease RusA
MKLHLPWPPKELSPNARVHWAKKSKAAKGYRLQCCLMTKAAKVVVPETEGRLHLWITFYPPDKRQRDDDNMIASFKSGRDGIADALGINDCRFITHPFVSDDIGNFIKVSITGGPDD